MVSIDITARSVASKRVLFSETPLLRTEVGVDGASTLVSVRVEARRADRSGCRWRIYPGFGPG